MKKHWYFFGLTTYLTFEVHNHDRLIGILWKDVGCLEDVTLGITEYLVAVVKKQSKEEEEIKEKLE